MGTIKTPYSNAVPVDTASVKHMERLFLNLKHQEERSFELWQCSQRRVVFVELAEHQDIPKTQYRDGLQLQQSTVRKLLNTFLETLI